MSEDLVASTSQRCFWHRSGGCYLGGGSLPLPKCTLCPNWVDRKDLTRDWFSLSPFVRDEASRGIQQTFTIAPGAAGGEGREADNAAGVSGEGTPEPRGSAGYPDPANPAPGKPRSLMDFG